jgi:hypothetical protein
MPEPGALCPNCQTPLAGRFCHGCGQEDRSSLFTLRQLVGQVVHQLIDVDGTLWRTLRRLVFHPGALTVDYLEGRRARYYAPLRLYLVVLLAFVAVDALVGEGSRFDPRPALNAGRTDESKKGRTSPEEWAEVRQKWLPNAMLALPPVFALFLMASHRRRYPHYSAHLFLALHVHAFACLLFTLRYLLQWPVVWLAGAAHAFEVNRWIWKGVQLGCTVYLAIAMGRVYRLRPASALARAVFLILVYGVFLLGLLAGVAITSGVLEARSKARARRAAVTAPAAAPAPPVPSLPSN